MGIRFTRVSLICEKCKFQYTDLIIRRTYKPIYTVEGNQEAQEQQESLDQRLLRSCHPFLLHTVMKCQC